MLSELINHAVVMRDQLVVAIVANVENLTQNVVDYDGTSLTGEFLTYEQHDAIQCALRSNEFETISFFEEMRFITDFCNNEMRRDGKTLLVMNSAQKGTAIGRKSLIPAFCDHNGIWYTGSNPYVVSLCRNKFHCDLILRQLGLSTIESWLYDAKAGWFLNKRPPDGKRIIAKLNHEAASIGLTRSCVMEYARQCDEALERMSETYSQAIIVQEFISGYEVECTVVRHPYRRKPAFIQPVGVSLNGDPFLGETILDYTLRNITRAYEWIDFRTVDGKLSGWLSELALKTIMALGIESFARVDFRIGPDLEPHITDIATNPHLTPGSSFRFAAELHGVSYPDALAMVLGHALIRWET